MRTALEASSLSKSYGGRQVLAGVDLAVETGVVAVAGPNGSGKTTLLKILASVVRPEAGSVRITRNRLALSGDARRRAVGFAGPDLAFYDDFTAKENLRFFLRAGGARAEKGRERRRLEAVGLGESEGIRVGAFSTGMKQRLRLAFAILFDPPILLLDEPMAGLDPSGREIVTSLVATRRREGAIVIASNDPRDLEGADAVLDLSAGSREPSGRR